MSGMPFYFLCSSRLNRLRTGVGHFAPTSINGVRPLL